MVSSPCAACKYLRRKCVAGCVFAPHFPHDEPSKFAIVHKAFGASNVSKMLTDLPPTHRPDAVTALCYEAEVLLMDKINGCYGQMERLCARYRRIRNQLATVDAEIYYRAGESAMDILSESQLLPVDPLNTPVTWGAPPMDMMVYNGTEPANLARMQQDASGLFQQRYGQPPQQ